MLINSNRIPAFLWLLVCIFSLSACYNGDEQAFREAVLISELGIVSIEEVLPIDAEGCASTIGIGVTLSYQALARTISSEDLIDISAQVRWSSSDNSIVSINESGEASGLSAGLVTIRAELAGLSASKELLVSPDPLKSISVSAVLESSKVVGICSLGHQLVAKGTYGDSDEFGPCNITKQVTWNSTDETETVAKVASDGKVSTYQAGEVRFSASYLVGTELIDSENSFDMKVQAALLEKITIGPQAETKITVGGSQQYVATGTYIDPASTQDITSTVEWTATNADGTTDLDYLQFSTTAGKEGLALGKAKGVAEIVASCSGEVSSNALSVAVTDPRTLVGVIITDKGVEKNTLRLKISDSPVQLIAKLKYSDDSTEVVRDEDLTTWRVKETKSGAGAKVSDLDNNLDDSEGEVTFTAVGTTVIEVSYDTKPEPLEDPLEDVITIIVEE